MPLSFSQKASVPADVLFTEVGNESVMLQLKSERYYGLEEVGTRMWKLLTAAETIEAAYQQLLAEYEVEPEVLRRDLEALIERLVEQGLLELSPAPVREG
jgi:hypothetical protein